MSKKQEFTKYMGVLVSQKMFDDLKALSDKRNTSIAAIVRSQMEVVLRKAKEE
jgi:hypothetical protein